LTNQFTNIFSRIDLATSQEARRGEPARIDVSRGGAVVSPLYGASKSFLIQHLFETEKQIVVLIPTQQETLELNVELNVLGISNIILINDFTTEAIQEKITEISRADKFVLVSTYQLLTLQLPSKTEIEQNTTKITAGGDLSYDYIIEYLDLLNYTRDKFVELPGTYSVRGSIIDFWSYSEKMPVRLEFDGDFIESVRYFDPENQRSTETVGTATIAGRISNSNPPQADKQGISIEEGNQPARLDVRRGGHSAVSIQHFPKGSLRDKIQNSNLFEYLDNPIVIASSYNLNQLFNTGSVKNISDELEDAGFNPDENKKEILAELEEQSFEEYTKDINARWIIEKELSSSNRIDLGFTESPIIKSNYKRLEEVLNQFAKDGYKIFITTENELQTKRMIELLSEISEALSRLVDEGKIKVITLAVKDGFVNKIEKILLLTDYHIFNKPYRTKLTGAKKLKRSRNRELTSIKAGDYIVHEDFGIGKYIGLETIKIGEAEQESMKLRYAQGDTVYVNLNYLHLVKRYSSKEGFTPTLSTLGSSEWVNTKRRAKKKIKEAARELIILYAQRKSAQGFQFSEDTVWQKELEASFIYEDTPDQSKASEEVKQDMQAINPMDRLLCGDVGFGKTEVAVRAAFKAVQDGKQVAVLVPTTILAEQHYNTFNDRLSQFPVKIAMLSRFQTKAKQKEIVDDAKEGKVDIVIGTHRLLSKDVQFKDIGLLIIDEEHRFGVMAKEKLRSLKVNVDTLTLTATPIPRTLNLSLLGARDLSLIATPPPNRQPIYTEIETFDIKKIKTWIQNEIHRSGQVYFVHDRIQSIEKISSYLLRYIPDLKIGVAHGQMKPAQLENIIHGFLNKKYDVLLSTKIIESGIDIPNVNTIIINRAERFGLAELHQLRGRVGRSDRQAYAYLLVPSLDAMNKKALKRLQVIEEFTDLGEGFNISMRDLEIRGAGNLLGSEQTGFIDEIGFDMYIKLINEAVEELKYEEFKQVFDNLPKHEEKTEPTIDAYFDIGIPANYMPEQTDRLSFYTEIYSIKTIEELEELKDEIIDRYGEMPILVKRLMLAATLKYYASKALFERVIIQRKNISIILPRGDKEEYYKVKFLELMRYIIDKYKDKIKFQQSRGAGPSAKDVMKLIIENKFESPEKVLEYLIEFSKEIKMLF
jgi:transcription-repair coupling factor (superfamily II helicase)